MLERRLHVGLVMAAASLALFGGAAGCRNRALEIAQRQCMAGCEGRNRTCILGATTTHALDGCTREVSAYIAFRPAPPTVPGDARSLGAPR